MASDSRTYWAAEESQPELVRRAMLKFGQHLNRMRMQGTLWKAYALMSAHDGWGVDGFRTASKLRIGGGEGEITELHINAVKPVVTNVLSLICAQRPAVKPRATNADSDTTAQTRLAEQLHDVYERRSSAGELDVETVRGGLLASQWWRLQEWAAYKGEEYAYDPETDSVTYEGDIAEFTLAPWQVATDMVASNVDERRWVLFCRQQSRHELIQRVKDPATREKLLDYSTTDALKDLSGEARSAWDDVQQLDLLRGDVLDPDDGVIVWELRHLPTPALPLGRLVKWVTQDCVLWDSMAADVGGQVRAVKYPFDAKELHAYDYAPERKPGTQVGHTAMFDLTGLQQFVDLCTTSMATSVDKMGVSNIWAEQAPGEARKLGRYGGVRILVGPAAAKPQVLDLPALKPEVVEALGWAEDEMAKAGALNPTVMGNPEKGMPASAQALQRAQAVQYHEVSQRGFVRLISRVANGRLRMLKRFARTERIAELAGKQGDYERRSWSAKDIAGVERFDVEPVNPMSSTFEGRQSILDMMQPGEVDAMGRLDFLQTGSLPKALQASTSRDELIDRNVAMLEQGIGLPPVVGADSMSGEPLFEAGGNYVRILKSDPHHLAIPRYLAVLNSAEAKTDARAVAALSAVMESQRLWTALTPDECIAFGVPMLPSQQMAMAAPPVMGAPSEAPPVEPSTPPGDEGAVNLPAPPASPLTGESETSDALELPNA